MNFKPTYIIKKRNERCYVYNIFTINHRWLVVIGSNLKLIIKLLFCQIIITSNNLILRALTVDTEYVPNAKYLEHIPHQTQKIAL